MRTLREILFGKREIVSTEEVKEERKPSTLREVVSDLKKLRPYSSNVPECYKNKDYILIGYHFSLPPHKDWFGFNFSSDYDRRGRLYHTYELPIPYFVPNLNTVTCGKKEEDELCVHCGPTRTSTYYAVPVNQLENIPEDELRKFESLEERMEKIRYMHFKNAGGTMTSINTGSWGLIVKTSIGFGNGEKLSFKQIDEESKEEQPLKVKVGEKIK